MPTSVILADDHAMVRQSLKVLLEREGFLVLGEAVDGKEAVRLAHSVSPDVAVMDISMPLFNGLDAALELSRTSKTKVILLTQHDEKQYVTHALRSGVKGYVLKRQAANDLVQAIREVCRGQVYLSPGVARAVVEGYSDPAQVNKALSVRERQVLQLIAESKSTKQIATLLGVSVKTVESHRTKLMQKLDIHEVAGLARYAIRHGIVQV
ncbi:MAG TPA: response regulator transcription factor [Steroidobacteraceae bacterium]